MKRLQQAKQLKQKVNKQLETLGRLQYRDVRILVKNMIYVTGMKMMGEGTEEVSPGSCSPLTRRDVLSNFCTVCSASSSPSCGRMTTLDNMEKSPKSSCVKVHRHQIRRLALSNPLPTRTN